MQRSPYRRTFAMNSADMCFLQQRMKALQDIEVVLLAVQDCQDAFKHASPALQAALQQDRSVVLQALEISACAYEYTTESLQD
eukprot:229714-Amphidinium_carterae.1